MKSNKNERGQILFEVLIVTLIFGAIAFVGAQVISVSLVSQKSGGDKTIAQELAKEGLEAVWAVSSEDWLKISNLDKGGANYYHPEKSEGKWILATSSEDVVKSGKTFVRSIVIDNVSRMASGTIELVYNPSNDDPSTQKAVVYVAFNNQTTTMREYFSRWLNDTLRQSDWSGGGGLGGPLSTTTNRYAEDDGNVDVSAESGSIQLSQ